MQKILEHLRDPSWWFTAVVVAVVASILAGIIKDFAERRFNLFLAWTRESRERRRRRRKEVVAAWSRSEGTVALSVLKLVFVTNVLVGVGVIWAIGRMVDRRPHDPVAHSDMLGLGIWGMFSLAIQVFIVAYVAYHTSVQALLTQEIVGEFCRKHGLPFLAEDGDSTTPIPALLVTTQGSVPREEVGDPVRRDSG